MRHVKKVNKDFYHTLIAIALPVVAQNGISNLVNLLDNIMVGKLGTEEVAGVSIANQFIFVHTLCLFGILSGPGVFTAQYHGANDLEGVRQSVRFKLYAGTLWTILAMLILKLFGTMDSHNYYRAFRLV